ncbi:MAG: NAD(P) transhydrogenase subunit alpha [Planctomycetales bacterium]|nr:NAD(P) transhydrogenase subunit alpha [Planctomycetales bacterium]
MVQSPAPAAAEDSVSAEATAPAESPQQESSQLSPRTTALLASLTIFVLAVFVGFEVIAKVPPTLHTPLMSGSNAISGITIVGAILSTGYAKSPFIAFVGMLALALAAVNVFGGFLVTHRMLEMFKKKK